MATQRFAGWSLLTIVGFSLTYAVVAHAQRSDERQPELEIKDVMKGAHVAPEGGKSLLMIVLEGEAAPEQKQELLDLYINLAENKPPKGEPADFHKKTFAVVLGAAKVVVGREGAEAELRKATNCAACHKDHKPPT